MTAAIQRLKARFFLDCFVVTLLAMTGIVYAEIIPTPKPERTMKVPVATSVTIIEEKKDHPIVIPPPPEAVITTSSQKPLNKREIELYREIFSLQHDANWAKADQLIRKIDNLVILGHVYAYRYLHPNYKAGETELKNWLDKYGDYPQASMISQKAKKPDPNRYKRRVNGTQEELRYFARGSKYISDTYKSGQRYEVNLVRQEVQRYLDKGAATGALNFFDKHRVQNYIDPIDKSIILADIASIYLYHGHVDKAKNTALKAVKTSREAPVAGWVMGLVSWIDNDMAESARYFTMASESQYASPWMTAAAAYWGARASTRAGLYSDVSRLLSKALKHQRTFYGLIATKALGYGYDFNWTMPEYTIKHQNILLQDDIGARAVALAQVGQIAYAEAELFAVAVKSNPKMAEAAIALAHHYNMAGYAMRFSSALANPAGGFYDAGLFPISNWSKTIKDGDQALINAFIRQESRFVSNARNLTGAAGLMQIMPNTAAFITEDPKYKTAAGRRDLLNPQTNVKIGSNYLNHLLDLDVVGNDLFGLTIAYNAGPGTYGRWKRNIETDDPLLFIELVPASETRAFVERVLTNYWIYQMQMGMEPTTLKAVAAGDWPRLN